MSEHLTDEDREALRDALSDSTLAPYLASYVFAACERIVQRHRAEALREAADAWEDPANTEELIALADKHYHAGGPSMPAIWLRERAGRIDNENGYCDRGPCCLGRNHDGRCAQ